MGQCALLLSIYMQLNQELSVLLAHMKKEEPASEITYFRIEIEIEMQLF